MITLEIVYMYYDSHRFLFVFLKYNIHRFPIAIKMPRTVNIYEIDLLMDEAKSMLEIKTYHENIVNLQGVTYKMNDEEDNLTEVYYIISLFIRGSHMAIKVRYINININTLGH